MGSDAGGWLGAGALGVQPLDELSIGGAVRVGRAVEGNQEKLAALETIQNDFLPGRWREARLPNRKELNATSVVSIKSIRPQPRCAAARLWMMRVPTGLTIWAECPQEKPLPPERDKLMTMDVAVPEYITKYTRKHK